MRTSVKKQATGALDWLEASLEGHNYIAAADYSIADITAQCAILMGKAVGVRVPETHSNPTGWWGRVTSRPTARA
ncbi:MAG: hypothetical protein K9G33_09840 [Sneathiella sp.]|nr:hypothetical protein [Sneathiella sp.]